MAENKKWAYSREYKAWVAMKHRCYNPSNRHYKDYGARGITVCDRWKDSFKNFLEDMGERPSDLYSLDRIDNDGNYEPGNVRWATKRKQYTNKRLSSLNNTGFPGIAKTANGKYKAQGYNKHIGTFDTLQEAVKARHQVDIERAETAVIEDFKTDCEHGRIEWFNGQTKKAEANRIQKIRDWIFDRGSHQGCPDWSKIINHLVDEKAELQEQLDNKEVWFRKDLPSVLKNIEQSGSKQ